MLNIIELHTPDIGMTTLRYEVRFLGKQQVHRKELLFSKRMSAVLHIRSLVLSYFRTSVESYLKASKIMHEDSLKYKTYNSDAKRAATGIVERYWKYICKLDTRYVDVLYSYIRIQSEFRKILPGKRCEHYEVMRAQVEELERLSELFYDEFTKKSGQMMPMFQNETSPALAS